MQNKGGGRQAEMESSRSRTSARVAALDLEEEDDEAR